MTTLSRLGNPLGRPRGSLNRSKRSLNRPRKRILETIPVEYNEASRNYYSYRDYGLPIHKGTALSLDTRPMITVNTAAAEVLMLHSAEFQMFEDPERDGQRHIIGELRGIPVALTFGAVDPRTGRTPAVRSRYTPSAKSQTTNHLNSV